MNIGLWSDVSGVGHFPLDIIPPRKSPCTISVHHEKLRRGECPTPVEMEGASDRGNCPGEDVRGICPALTDCEIGTRHS